MNTLLLKRIYDILHNKISRKDLFKQILKTYNSKNKFVIQIGANDGIHADPIRDYIIANKMSGILIEPQKKLFDRLIQNYQIIDGLKFFQAAISNFNGKTELYKVKEDDKENWYNLIASLNPDKGDLKWLKKKSK